MSRLSPVVPIVVRTALAVALLGAALLAGLIGGDDVLTAVTGEDQDSPGAVLVTVGALFVLAGAALALLALAALRAPRGTRTTVLACLVPAIAIPWWEAVGPPGALINAATLLAAIALARRLAGS